MISLVRFHTDDFGTFGKLFINGSQVCVTLERALTGDHPAIPCGTFNFYRFQSPHNGDVWRTDEVPGRTAIEIHSANLASQLLGCIAVGESIGTLNGVPAILNSKKTLSMLHTKLPDNFQLTITEDYQ